MARVVSLLALDLVGVVGALLTALVLKLAIRGINVRAACTERGTGCRSPT